jgi:ketosteroid isomerase-like protein
MKTRMAVAVTGMILASLTLATALEPSRGALEPSKTIAATGEKRMTTKETIQGYFARLKQGSGWEGFLAEDMIFASLTSPMKEVRGKEAYLRATQRFYTSIAALEVRNLIVEGEQACVLTRYQLQAPGGGTFQSDVAEIFAVKDGKITSFAIYFDSAPFPK